MVLNGPGRHIHAILRESLYGLYMSELRAHQVSTLTAMVFFG